MTKRLTDYQDQLLIDLQDEKEAIEYLNAALEDKDPRVFLLAIKNVILAQNASMSAIAKKAKLNRENLYRMLSEKGNPKINSLVPVLHSLGYHLSVKPYKNK